MSDPPAFQKIKILLADDEETITSAFQVLLTDAGYQVVGVAHNGLEAVELARKLKPDLIIMDILMPEIDGIEAARRINKERFTPIVLVTAFADQDLIRRAKEARVLGYLLKPVIIDDLIPAVELAYEIASRLRELTGEVENLSEELATRKLVERAKGLLMDTLGLKEAQAMRLLQKESRRRRMKIGELAKTIIEAKELLEKAQTSQLP
ncbi:response regulator [Thermosulfuriphilus ammonigenes]|uniref:Response regulator n=1 Tax=Thermosulfuriphilus ammonigenes TaxID=1936021 RepID=A0A6G7PW26_9BACT|nr:response regulator [Thermosulfuriphilus ammonigenes]MBA2847946.1 response regulator NasT [Thermosulfuriphilus ammonigenes]QIJ71862.1 response regulator [Thermosulfuriphilus ammonigenes]HFB83946.1 response regulator [Thermodesulfatator sp.]